MADTDEDQVETVFSPPFTDPPGDLQSIQDIRDNADVKPDPAHDNVVDGEILALEPAEDEEDPRTWKQIEELQRSGRISRG